MKIVSNTAISLDGKIATKSNDIALLGSQLDFKKVLSLRNQADAILVGGKTFRNWPHIKLPKENDIDEPVNFEPKLHVVLTRNLNFKITDEMANEELIQLLFFVSNKTIPKNFPFDVVVIQDQIKPRQVIDELENRGIKNLLIEAGGDVIFQFLQAGFIDEMHVTLTPQIIGGKTSPSLVTGEGFQLQDIKKLKLLSQQTEGDEIFLHYRVLH